MNVPNGNGRVATQPPHQTQNTQPDFTDAQLREQALTSAVHLAAVACFDGVRAKTSNALDIRSLFTRRSAAAEPDRARPKHEGRAIVLAANTIILAREGFKPSSMALLGVDFDDDNLGLREVQSAAVEFFGSQSIACAFSTASSKPDARRWRLFVPLAQPITPELWLRILRGFAHYLKAFGVVVDATAERATQLHHLPNVPFDLFGPDKKTVIGSGRNPITGQPLHFEHEFWGSELFEVQRLTDTAMLALAELDALDEAAEGQRQQQAAERALKRAEREAQRQQALANGGDGLTPIERFNLEHETADLMLKYGYIESADKPGHWRSPLQTSSSYATVLRDDATWFSLSGSDASAGLGSKQGSGVGGDAFDLFTFFEHGGNRSRAVAAVANRASVGSFTGVAAPEGVRPFGVGGGLATPNGGIYGRIAELQGRPAGLVSDGKGGYAASKHNLMTALLTDGFCYGVAFDGFLGEVLVCEPNSEQWRPIREDDYFNAARCLEAQDFRSISTANMREAILAAARERTFDSAKDWLNGLPAWDGVDRIGPFLEQAFGVTPSEYHTAISRYMWSALAGRVLHPGCKADMVPTAVGRQGAGKSSVVKGIAPFESGFGELNLGTEESNLFREMRGRLVMELPELSGMRKRESEDLKRFVASTTNVWIEKYQTSKTVYPRRCIFVGTSNQRAILNDPTGSRRWLPFECGTCNPQWVIDNREQLWAQGAVAFRETGVEYEGAERLARDVHEDFRASDPWEVQIARWLQAPGVSGVAPEARNAITTTEVMTGLGIPTHQQDRRTEMRVANALKALGYEQTRPMVNGKRRYLYVKPTK